MKALRFRIWLTRQAIAKRVESAEVLVVWHLPRWVIRWATVRAYVKAWEDAGTREPDELTYDEVAKAADRV